VGFPSAPPPIGRDREVAAVRALLLGAGRRVITLTGPGGIGKTRLALAVAESLTPEFPDGAAFVPLAAISDPALVLPSIARALDLREIHGASPRQTLVGALRDRRLLLVLDNVEHLAGPAVVDDLSALTTACPALRLLVTSRTPLHLHDEQIFATPALALPPSATGSEPTVLADFGAIALFADRARAVRQDFALTAGNAAPVVEICRRLDGLALAIELAAAWVRVLPPADLLRRLEPRLPLLRGGAADQPMRLRTMRDAIAWSYDRLSDDERRVFRRLSTFVGGFTLDAAEWVTGVGFQVSGTEPGDQHPSPVTRHPSPVTLDLVASLVDQSLLVPSASDGPEPRFTMLETIREFGQEQLAASGEEPAIAARHAAWCARFAETEWRSGGVSQRRGLTALEAEHPNFRAALSWLLARGQTTAALHLASVLAEFWAHHSHFAEGQAWLKRTLAAAEGPATAARAAALVGQSMLLWQWADFAQATQLLDEAEKAAHAAGDAGMLAYARLHQGYIALWSGDYARAATRGEESLATCAMNPQGFSCHGALWLLATATLAVDENERASDLFERLLASARAVGDEISLANSHYGLAVLAERRGALPQALAGFAEAATVSHGYGDRVYASYCLDSVAATAIGLDFAEPAVRFVAAGRALRVALGATHVTLFEIERQPHEQALAMARAALGDKRFAVVWAAGEAPSFDAAVAEAAALAQRVIAPAPTDADGFGTLTLRERQTLRLLVEGRSDREIAAALFISQRTASNHVGAILRKLNVATRAEAAVQAVRAGLG
jgi:non-specific serine/threonine protein kinase